MLYLPFNVVKPEILFCSKNPKVQEVDMLHAADYSQMDMEELSEGIEQSKKFDKEIKKKI